MENLLLKVLELQKQGKQVGIWSACTANALVLEAAMRHALETNTILLIEATANQVDQYGGYTGMKPVDFVRMIKELSAKTGFPESRLVLGGDHLGPLTFSKYNEDKAVLRRISTDVFFRTSLFWNNTKYFTGFVVDLHSYAYRERKFSLTNAYGTVKYIVGFDFLKKKQYKQKNKQ